MKRRRLKTLGSEQRHQFRAKFVKLADKPSYRGVEVAIVLENVRLWPEGVRVAGRIVFTWTVRFQRLGRMASGQWIDFRARVVKKQMVYRGPDYLQQTENLPRVEWKLSHPSQIRKVEQEEMA